MDQAFDTWVWVKIEPGYGPQVLVFGSICRGSFLGLPTIFEPHPASEPALRLRVEEEMGVADGAQQRAASLALGSQVRRLERRRRENCNLQILVALRSSATSVPFLGCC